MSPSRSRDPTASNQRSTSASVAARSENPGTRELSNVTGVRNGCSSRVPVSSQ